MIYTKNTERTNRKCGENMDLGQREGILISNCEFLHLGSGSLVLVLSIYYCKVCYMGLVNHIQADVSCPQKSHTL